MLSGEQRRVTRQFARKVLISLERAGLDGHHQKSLLVQFCAAHTVPVYPEPCSVPVLALEAAVQWLRAAAAWGSSSCAGMGRVVLILGLLEREACE